VIEGKTVYQLSKQEFQRKLANLNITQQKSLVSQRMFENLVVNRELSFSPEYEFKNSRQKVALLDVAGERYLVSPYAFKNVKSKTNKRTAAKREFEKQLVEANWTKASDYEYIKSNDKVSVICTEGHLCLISPTKFKSGKRCAVCAGNVKYNTESFIVRAKEVHGDKYDYSITEYKTNNKTQVGIICPKHGKFFQAPSDHINQKSGCQKCKFEKLEVLKAKSHEQFIEDAIAVHGQSYKYNKTKYERSNIYVMVTCPKHGDFEQLPNVHLRGSGCQSCANERLSIIYRKTTEKFIEEAKQTHGERYDYSLAEYKTAHDKVTIVCHKHGLFEQVSFGHLNGSGCNRCAIEDRADKQRKSKGAFIAEAIRVHGERYDYSLVDYKNICTPVQIICSKHGVFNQRPSSHLIGSSCIHCGHESTKKKQTKTTEGFITQALEIHDGFYDYSLVEYVNSNGLVKIVCEEHGVFVQLPSVHLTGAGCKQCGIKRSKVAKTMTQEEFIRRANEVHNSKYDYSLARYKLSQLKVKIICPNHGVFEQVPNSHLGGAGCRQCSLEAASERQRMTTGEFIEIARKIHGDKFDYSLVDYKLSHEKVKINCPVHGDFEQTPIGHLSSSNGCKKCADDKNGYQQRKSTDEFIKVANSVHGDRYDYSLTEYTTALTKVAIICIEHGLFMQSPRVHLKKSHCPKCNYGKGVGTYDSLYFCRNPDERFVPCDSYYVKFTKGQEIRYKVGMDSTGNRWKSQYKGWNVEFLLRQQMTKFEAWKWESSLLEKNGEHRYRVREPEFVGNGSTEMFLIDILGLDSN